MEYDPDLRSVPLTREEITLAVHARPHPTPIPAVGDVVWYRAQQFGDLVEAVVTAVQEHPYLNEDGTPDANVWYLDNISGEPLRLLPDPWPKLWLDTVWHDEQGNPYQIKPPISCREARVRGSVGWLPYDWPGRLVTHEELREVPRRFHEWRISR